MTSMLSERVIFSETSHFVIRSQITIRLAMMMWYFLMAFLFQTLSGDNGPPLNFLQGGAAALAHRGIPLIPAHVHGIIPAAFAFLSRRLFYLYVQRRVAVPAGAAFYLHIGDNQQKAQVIAIALQQRRQLFRSGHDHGRFQGAANALLLAGDLQ